MTALDPQLIAKKTAAKFWRCPRCGEEAEVRPLEKPERPAWCHNGHESATMVWTEQERIYPSEAARTLIENFERSDWGLLGQALEHYKRNRRSAARRNPGADAVLARGVYPRFDAMARAIGEMRRQSPGDTDNGGRVAERWPA